MILGILLTLLIFWLLCKKKRCHSSLPVQARHGHASMPHFMFYSKTFLHLAPTSWIDTIFCITFLVDGFNHVLSRAAWNDDAKWLDECSIAKRLKHQPSLSPPGGRGLRTLSALGRFCCKACLVLQRSLVSQHNISEADWVQVWNGRDGAGSRLNSQTLCY